MDDFTNKRKKRTLAVDDNPREVKRARTDRLLFDSVTTNNINKLLKLLESETDLDLKFKIIDRLSSIVITGKNSERITDYLIEVYNIPYKTKEDLKLAAYAKEALIKKRIACEELYKHMNKCINDLEEFLIAKLQHSDETVRITAAQVLAKISSIGAVQPLINALHDQNADVRGAAVIALGKIQSIEVVQPIINALHDQDADVRRIASVELRFSTPREITLGVNVRPLINALYYSDIFIVGNVISVLINIIKKDKLEPLLIRKLSMVLSSFYFFYDKNFISSIVKALGNIGGDVAADHIIKALSYPCNIVIKSVAMALGTIGTDRAVDYLINVLSDHNKVALSGVVKLGKIKSNKLVQYLITKIQDDSIDYKIRILAIEALGKAESDIVVQYLNAALSDSNKNIRLAAAEAFGAMGTDKAVQPLITALSDDDADVRLEAAIALGKIRSDKAVQPLTTALFDDNVDIRLEAAVALGKIRSDKAVQPLTVALSDNNVAANSDDIIFSKLEVAKALSKIAPNIAASDEVVDPIIKILSHSCNVDLLYRAAIVLGNIGSDKAIQPLINALSDDKTTLGAARALGKMGSDEAVEYLIQALCSNKNSMAEYEISSACLEIGTRKSIKAFLNFFNKFVKKCDINTISPYVEILFKEQELCKLIEFAVTIKNNKDKLENHIKKIDLLCCRMEGLPMEGFSMDLKKHIVDIAM